MPVRPQNRCTAANKAGNRCGAPKATLKTLDGDIKRYRVCIGHLTKAVGSRKMAEVFGFKFGSDAGTGRHPRPSALEVIRHMVEEEHGIDEVVRPLFEGLNASRAVVVGNGPSAHVETVGDPEVAMKAAERILDRVYGKPKQTTELSGPDGGPISVEVPTGEERQQQVASLLAGALGATPAVNGGNGHGNGHAH